MTLDDLRAQATLDEGPFKACAVAGCGRSDIVAHGWCRTHYNRWYACGDVRADVPIAGRRSPEERFFQRVEKSDGGCWIWTGTKSWNGYGKFFLDGKLTEAHRAAYRLFVGPIPQGLELDHLCRVRACVNPEHLEPVTHAENVRRGTSYAALSVIYEARRARTHCARGHLYDEANTAYQANNGARVCRACNRERYHQRKRETVAA